MAEADVRAALTTLSKPGSTLSVSGSPEEWAALCLVTAHLDAGARAGEIAMLLRKYGADHIEGKCAKWAAREFAGVTHWEWLKDEPCTCGLSDLLLPPAAPELGEGPGA